MDDFDEVVDLDNNTSTSNRSSFGLSMMNFTSGNL